MNRKLLALLTTTAVALSMSAAALDTVQIDGYQSEERAPWQFSITNVASSFEVEPAAHGYPAVNAYKVEKSCTIALNDDNLLFEVIPGQVVNNEWGFETPETADAPAVTFPSLPINDAAGCPLAGVDLESDEYDPCSHLKGCSVTLDKPGVYFISVRYGAIDGAAMAYVDIGDNLSDTPAGTNDKPAGTNDQPAGTNDGSAAAGATPTTAKVLVNGVETAFNAYEINGNNFFKLRDLAAALNGTDKQFNVTWDEANNAIGLVSGTAYTAVGGELAAGDGAAKQAKPATASVTKDGAALALTAFEISDNNYFKLRDVAQAFDIGIGWDDATQTITVDTTQGYVEDAQ